MNWKRLLLSITIAILLLLGFCMTVVFWKFAIPLIWFAVFVGIVYWWLSE